MVSANEIIQEKTDKDFWENLERIDKKKIPRYNSKNSDLGLNEEYLLMLKAIEKTLKDNEEIKVGQIVNGVIAKITPKEVVIDFNYKDFIYVEYKASDYRIIENLKQGDNIDVMITDIIDNPYQIKGSITELIKLSIASKLKEYYSEAIPLEAKVKELIPAGFMLDIDIDLITITAFMPNILAGVNRLTKEQAEDLKGETIHVLLESLQQDKGAYVVSRKKYLKTLIPEEIKKLDRNKTLYKGTVTGTKNFGVFVEFNNCLTGMIHKVNLKSDLRNDISSIKAGSNIEFYVRDVIKGNKIILTQVITESLWDKIKVGKIIKAKVIDKKSFGVLVELDAETTGLIQNVYLKDDNRHFEAGDEVKVKVISVIRDDRKIYLDLA